jgi:hypothetical protein
MRTPMLAVAISLLTFARSAPAEEQARPEGVPGEVQLAGAADVRALCDELKQGGDAASQVYVMAIPSSSFAFSPFDRKKGRLSVDLSRVHGAGGAWELEADGGLAVAVPASGKDAASLLKQAASGELTLWLWFKPAHLSGLSFHCAAVRGVRVSGVRLGVEPMAFALVRGKDVVASGETQAFSALRDVNGPIDAPAVRVGQVVKTDEASPAPDEIARSARALEPELVACYKKGLSAEPTLRGAVVMGVRVDAAGKVADARAELDGLGAPEVTACVAARVKATRFPAGKAARYSVPLDFGPAE